MSGGAPTAAPERLADRRSDATTGAKSGDEPGPPGSPTATTATLAPPRYAEMSASDALALPPVSVPAKTSSFTPGASDTLAAATPPMRTPA